MPLLDYLGASLEKLKAFISSSACSSIDAFGRQHLVDPQQLKRIVVISGSSRPASILAHHLVEELRVRFIAGKQRNRADREPLAVLEIELEAGVAVPAFPFRAGDVLFVFGCVDPQAKRLIEAAQESAVPLLVFDHKIDGAIPNHTICFPDHDWSIFNCMLCECAMHSLCEFFEPDRPVPAVKESLFALQNLLQQLHDDVAFVNGFAKTKRLMNEALGNGCPIFVVGNGGSACDAQIISYFAGLSLSARGLAGHIEAPLKGPQITCAVNDGFKIFERSIEPFGGAENPVFLLGLSTSGNSENIKEALLSVAKKSGNRSMLALLGVDGGKIAREISAENQIIIPHGVTARIQELHLLIGTALFT